MGRGPSLASKKLCCCERALSPFINCILGKKGYGTFKKGLGIKHVLVVERLAMCPLHSTLNFRGVGGSGPGCVVAMLICQGIYPSKEAGTCRAGQILSYSLRQSVRCRPFEMNPLDVFLAMLRARSASTRSKGFLRALLICGELSKFNMKRGSGQR